MNNTSELHGISATEFILRFFNKFQQKNRSRAIHITDIAIDKVPKTNISCFDNEQNTHIQTLHRLVLQEAQRLNQLYNTNENEGHKNNNGTLAIKKILKKAKQYGLIYKKGRKSI